MHMSNATLCCIFFACKPDGNLEIIFFGEMGIVMCIMAVAWIKRKYGYGWNDKLMMGQERDKSAGNKRGQYLFAIELSGCDDCVFRCTISVCAHI